jgi:hypothetical protein
MTRRDLKLRDCLNSFTGHGELPELKTEALRPVGAAYDRNIRRVYALVLFAPAAIWIAITVQRHTDQIEHQFPKKDNRTRVALIDQAMKTEIAQHTAIFARGGKEANELLDQQHKVSFQMLSSQSPEFNDGPEAWMASQIIATWTAFESMAEDLWEAALNIKPKTLATLAGRNQSIKAKPGDEPKRIKLDWLYRYDFNLSQHMGTIFLEDNRYQFDRLDGIRQAYTDAFSVDSESIIEIINGKSLDASSLIRNNLVHNGGIIDSEYLRRSSVLPIEARGSLGAPILIDGELVANINGPVIKAGHDLVVAVDDWLASH